MKLGCKRSWLQIKYYSLINPIFVINRQVYKSYHSCKCEKTTLLCEINFTKYQSYCKICPIKFTSGLFSEKKAAEKKKNPNIMRPGTKPKANIKSMFMAQAATGKKKVDVR